MGSAPQQACAVGIERPPLGIDGLQRPIDVAEPALAGFLQDQAITDGRADAAGFLAPLAGNLEPHRIVGTQIGLDEAVAPGGAGLTLQFEGNIDAVAIGAGQHARPRPIEVVGQRRERALPVRGGAGSMEPRAP